MPVFLSVSKHGAESNSPVMDFLTVPTATTIQRMTTEAEKI